MATRSTTRSAPPTFREGDVVVRLRAGVSVAAGAAIDSGTVGTICRVITAGRTYKVVYDDFDMCLVVFHDSLRLAPPGTAGPACPEDC
jgi:hypothetical protein